MIKNQASIISHNQIENQAMSITQKEMEELWEYRYNELMKKSKEELIEMIIGQKAQVGILIG